MRHELQRLYQDNDLQAILTDGIRGDEVGGGPGVPVAVFIRPRNCTIGCHSANQRLGRLILLHPSQQTVSHNIKQPNSVINKKAAATPPFVFSLAHC